MKLPEFLNNNETGNWSAGRDYSFYKVMRWLYAIDNYRELASLGTQNMNDDFYMDTNTKNLSRIYALMRLRKAMDILISNTIKLVRSKYQDEMIKYHKEVRDLRTYINSVYKIVRNEKNKTQMTVINEALFDRVLDRLEFIKTEITNPLNKSNLIFKGSEEIEPQKMKEQLIDRLSNEG